jgi:hypothetical protein
MSFTVRKNSCKEQRGNPRDLITLLSDTAYTKREW